MRKPRLNIRMTLLAIIGALNLLIAALIGNGVYESWINFRQAQAVKQASFVIDAFYNANRTLSLERATSLAMMYVEPDTAEFLREDLTRNRKYADMSLEQAFLRLKNENTAQIESKYQSLLELRNELDAALAQPQKKRDIAISDRIFKIATSLISEIQNFLLAYSGSYRNIDATVDRQLTFKYFVWELAEYTGEEYAIIGKMIAEDKKPSAEQQEQLTALRGRIQYGWDILRKFSLNDAWSERLLPFMEEAETHYFLTFDQIRGLFYGFQPASASYPISIEMWLGMAEQAVDSLLILQDEVLKQTQNHINLMEENASGGILASLIIFLCACLLSIYCWSIVVFRIAQPINAMINALYRTTQGEIFDMPKIHHQHDEIGKLAHVLTTFQDNVRKIRQSNEELERFAYIAAHDLKSPLRAVDNISQWLEEDLEGSLPEKDREYMSELRRRVRLMDKLLDDTLEYARIGAEMEIGSTEIVSGTELIEEITTLLALPEGFIIQMSDRFAQLHVQKLPIQQVLYNLVNNALKHHDKPKGKIEIDAEKGDEEYIFSVRDDGPGIDPQYHQKIFEMFQTLQPRDKSKGRGMGLAMVRKIVANNGGDITVQSQPGKGAEFRFTWPKSQIHEAKEIRKYA